MKYFTVTAEVKARHRNVIQATDQDDAIRRAHDLLSDNPAFDVLNITAEPAKAHMIPGAK